MSDSLHENTALIRATVEYRDALFDFAEGRIAWRDVLDRIHEVRRALKRRAKDGSRALC
jgi:hypothetical protein